jgi:hypothetical protein
LFLLIIVRNTLYFAPPAPLPPLWNVGASIFGTVFALIRKTAASDR